MSKKDFFNSNEKSYEKRLHCSASTFDRITTECVEEFLKHHPEFKGMNITQGFILDKISRYYLQ